MYNYGLGCILYKGPGHALLFISNLIYGDLTIKISHKIVDYAIVTRELYKYLWR